MTRPRVSYYAHHFGTGHLRHAQKVAASGLFELQVASTGPRNASLLTGALEYVELGPDVGTGEPDMEDALDSYLHYAPTGALIQRRFAELNQAWRTFKPDVVMVDVSVEVALFARLSGYKVAFRRMPGVRTDKPHQMAYELADALFAYFPERLEEPDHLERFGHKSHYLAVAEPLTADGVPATAARPPGPRTVVVQTSLASSISLEQVAHAAAASPAWNWEVVGSVESARTALPRNLTLHGVVAQPRSFMQSADVVATSAGHNAVVAAAGCGRPVLLIPEERPFAEQREFARSLHRAAGVPMLESWQTQTDWPALLERTSRSNPHALGAALFVPPAQFERDLAHMVQTCTAAADEPAAV